MSSFVFIIFLKMIIFFDKNDHMNFKYHVYIKLIIYSIVTNGEKSNGTKNGTVTFSSRLYTDIFNMLEKEALSKNISMNSLINNILGKYTSLDRYASELGLISLTKRAIVGIFNELDDDAITQLSKSVGGIVHKELIFLKFDEMSFDNLIDVIKINATRYGTVKHNFKNSKHSICIHHGACIGFSKFLSLVHENMASQLSVKLITKNIDQNTMCMEIHEP